MTIKSLRSLCIAVALLCALPAHAQSLNAQPDPVEYIVAPEVPGPNQPVNITVEGVGSFLGDADVTWSVNGVVAKEGTGASSFDFTTGAIGQQSIVRVSIDSATQGVITHTFTFIPSSVNLVWEADTSVPPLYQGHALYSAGSMLKVVAFPTVVVEGTKVAAQSLSYQWSVGDNPLPQSSGTGKYTLSYQGSQLNDGEDIAVDVYFGSLKVGHGEIHVPASQPTLLFYNKDALRGIVWDQALPASIALNAKEITLFAQPYFFSNDSLRKGAVPLVWSLDGSPVTGPQAGEGILTLRQTGTAQGQSQVSVSAQNGSDTQLVQSAEATLTIVFGHAQSGLTSLFGL